MIFEHKIYKRSEIPESFNVVEICGGSALVVYDDKINFAVMRFSFEKEKEKYYGCFWYGWGTGEPLREMRHSYFGEPQNYQEYVEGENNGGDLGYVFYFNKNIMIEAIEELSKIFDMD